MNLVKSERGNIALRTSSDGLADLVWVEILVHLQVFFGSIKNILWLSRRIFQKYSPTCRWYRQCTRRETQCSSSQVGLRDSCKPVLLLKPLDLSLKLWSPDQGSLPPPEIESHLVSWDNPPKRAFLIGWMYAEWKENDGTCSLVGSTMLWSMAVITASQIVQVTKLPGEDLLIFLEDEWSIRQCWIRGEICPGRQCFMEQVIPPSACWIARVGATSTVALRRTRRSCILVNVVSETKQKNILAYHQLKPGLCKKSFSEWAG